MSESWLDLARCEQAWQSIAATVRVNTAHAAAANRTLLTAWDGAAARAYDAWQTRTAVALSDLSTVADEVAAVLAEATVLVRSAEFAQLDVTRWLAVRAAGESQPAIQSALAHAAAVETERLRRETEATLGGLLRRLEGAVTRLSAYTDLAAMADLRSAPWLPALDPTAAGSVIIDGSRFVITGSNAADTIWVGTDQQGSTVVRVNGDQHRVPAGLEVVVRAGGGDDEVTVARGCTVRVSVLGGAGDDVVEAANRSGTALLGLWGADSLRGGSGDDYLSGGAGRDYLDGQGGADVLIGGSGNDTGYGLAGDDLLRGGSGQDYLDGGPGADAVAGGADADVIAGGLGDDTLDGGAGSDVLYAGAGVDRLTEDVDDRAFVSADDVVSGTGQAVTVAISGPVDALRIEGSPEFVGRVQSDLDTLRSSPRGAAMLAALGSPEMGGTLVIRETPERNGHAFWQLSHSGGVDATVTYNPSFNALRPDPTPPVVVLYHELAHVYDAFAGTLADGTYWGPDNPGVPNREREAVGLPVAGPDPSHPYPLTENGLREEMGLPRRTLY